MYMTIIIRGFIPTSGGLLMFVGWFKRSMGEVRTPENPVAAWAIVVVPCCAMLTRQDPIEFRDLNIVLRRERLAQLKELNRRMER